MSAANIENAEDQDEEPINSSENSTSSCTSTDTGTTTTSTTTSSESSDTSTINSTSSTDNEDDNDEILHHHRHCLKSMCPSGEQANIDVGDGRKQPSTNHERGADRLQTTSGHKCDKLDKTGCPCATRSELRCKGSENDRRICCREVAVESPSQMQPGGSKSNKRDNAPLERGQSTSSKLSTASKNIESKHGHQHHNRSFNLSTKTTSLGSSYSNLSSGAVETAGYTGTQTRRALKPAPAPSPSPSMSIIDTNNNKNSNSQPRESMTSIRRTNFSKSASGIRLVSRSRPNVCDCLSQDCGEKKHSNRRHFIEQYYNSRTQLSTGDTSTSFFNISTPLNRLSECDAITKRLLSSPIRATPDLVEATTCRSQVSDVDKSRRASLGTSTLTDQVFLFTSSPFKYLELNYRNRCENQKKNHSEKASKSEESNIKLKQQSRSLSVCDEETLKPRVRGSNTGYTSNLNRAISLASDAGTSSSSKRLLTIIPLFGCDIKSLEQFTKLGLILPPAIDSAVQHILVNGINSVGIFRKSGVKSRILTLKQKIETNQNIKFDELNQNNEFSIYDIADLVKMWFRELKPLPLLTKELIKLITTSLNASSHVFHAPMMKRGLSSQQDNRTTSSTSRSNSSNSKYLDPNLRSKIGTMTTSTHRALLLKALTFLAQISSRCEFNQMTSQNLAICLTPSLCATESDQNSILLAQKALEFCIDNHRNLFGHANEKI